MLEIKTYNYAKAFRIDPTRTTTLRNAFVREMNKRFIRLRGVIRKAIVDEDCFGLEEITTQVMTPPGRRAFAFSRSSDKVEAFMRWLRMQMDEGLLQVTEMAQVGLASEAAWTNLYIQDSYQRGVMRARRELRNAGYAIPSIEQTGGLAISMSTPFHMDRVGLLYSRVFSELRGITNAMDQQISRVLAQGIADGDNPRLLARKLTKTIFGKQGDLALTDTLGRFIPAQRRAQTLARTEIIRAHHQATIQEYRNWGLEGVRVKAEWSTAGFGVCPECAAKEAGNPYTLDQIESMIPYHPNCFIDRQIPIYTSKGWKQIGDIEVGDLVLTHKKRFRKVTELIKQEKQTPEVIKFKFKGDCHLSMTFAHPVLIERKGKQIWEEAGKCLLTDKVFRLNTYTELYNIIPLEIEKIEKYTPKNKTRTYNFSVEEDESYMAKGIVVHNCRCMALPLEVGAEVIKEKAVKSRARIPIKETLNMVEGKIRRLLHEELYAFDSKGKLLIKEVGNKNSVIVSSESLGKLQNSILTHNHPAGNMFEVGNMCRIGNSFSVHDIILAIRGNVSEIRAVTPEFTFVAKRTASSGRFWGITPSEVKRAFEKANREVTEILMRRINLGITTVNKADTIHWHLVNRRVARELGYEYTKFRI